MRVPVLFAALPRAVACAAAVAFCALGAAALAAGKGGKTVEPAPRFDPDPAEEVEGLAEYRDGNWFAAGPGWTLVLRRVEGGERKEYIERNVGIAADPFGGPPGAPERYLTWILVLENTGEETSPSTRGRPGSRRRGT